VVVSGGITELTDPVTATYTSTLTVTGRETGSYCFVVTNSRSTVVSQMLLVQGEYTLYIYLATLQGCGWGLNMQN